MFGIFNRPALGNADDAVDVSTPRPDDNDDDDEDGSTQMEGADDDDEDRPGTAGTTLSEKRKKAKKKARGAHMTRISDERSALILRGEYRYTAIHTHLRVRARPGVQQVTAGSRKEAPKITGRARARELLLLLLLRFT
jgi:hypothetical protein